MHCRRYPSMSCRSLGGWVVSQHGLQVSRPTPRGEVEGSGQGVSRPTPGRSPGPHLRGGVQAPHLGVSQNALRQTPSQQMATVAGGTHPTGMHSCPNLLSITKYLIKWDTYDVKSFMHCVGHIWNENIWFFFSINKQKITKGSLQISLFFHSIQIDQLIFPISLKGITNKWNNKYKLQCFPVEYLGDMSTYIHPYNLSVLLHIFLQNPWISLLFWDTTGNRTLYTLSINFLFQWLFLLMRW